MSFYERYISSSALKAGSFGDGEFSMRALFDGAVPAGMVSMYHTILPVAPIVPLERHLFFPPTDHDRLGLALIFSHFSNEKMISFSFRITVIMMQH